MKDVSVSIADECDAFSITVKKGDEHIRVRITQEEMREELIKIFEFLDIEDVTYEEVY